MTKTVLEDRGASQIHVRLVTPEPSPLAVFGAAASETVAEVLAGCKIAVHTQTTPVVFRDGALVVVPGQAIRTQQVVSIPVPEGRQIRGFGRTGADSSPVDEHGRVEGRDDVFAVGDMTAFPIKQVESRRSRLMLPRSGLRLAGAEIEPRPFRPVLRGLLLTGLRPRFLRSDPLAGSSEVDMEPLWWPPGKIAGRYLAPFAEHLGLSSSPRPVSSTSREHAKSTSSSRGRAALASED